MLDGSFGICTRGKAMAKQKSFGDYFKSFYKAVTESGAKSFWSSKKKNKTYFPSAQPLIKRGSNG